MGTRNYAVHVVRQARKDAGRDPYEALSSYDKRDHSFKRSVNPNANANANVYTNVHSGIL